MKKKHFALFLAGTLFLSNTLAVLPDTTSDAAAKPKLSNKKISITVKKSKTVQVKNVKKKALKKIVWSTKNKKIATVKKSGTFGAKITAKAKGSTKITAKISLKSQKKPVSLSVTVTVKKSAPTKTQTPASSTPITTSAANTAPAVSAAPTATPAATPIVTKAPVEEKSGILKAYDGIFEYMGTCANYYGYDVKKDQLRTREVLDFIKDNFNSITLENEMKPDAVFSTTWSWGGSTMNTLSLDEAKKRGYFIPETYTESIVPELRFDVIDSTLETLNKEGLRMRGHTFVWHQQTPVAFFTKNYAGSSKVDPATMDARLEFFIRNVMRHVMEKEKELTGSAGSLVYAWDMVNEYIHRTHDATSITWHNVFGDQKLTPDYIKRAFEIGYEELENYGVQDKVVLYYNDYNTYECADDIVSLINFINKDAKICGGIGMQSHVCVDYPTVEQYGKTLEKFMNTGLEVSITELDASINYDKTGKTDAHGWEQWDYKDKGQTDEDQAEFIKSLMEVVVSKQKNRDRNVSPKGIVGVTIWGLFDKCSWKANTRPLLFGDSIYDEKPSYEAFMEAASIWNK